MRYFAFGRLSKRPGWSRKRECGTNREVFEAYMARILSPKLRPGQVVMDNLAANKREQVRELIEGQGCELLYLPPHSRDLDPI